MKILAKRNSFNFDVNDVENVAEKYGLHTKYNHEAEGTRIVIASNERISLKLIQSKLEKPSGLVHVVLNAKIPGLPPRKYEENKKLVDSFKSKFDVSFVPEGDFNIVKLLEHPEYYLKNGTDLFNQLGKMDRKIGASISARLNNRKNDLEDVNQSLRLVDRLEREIVSS